VVAAVIAAIETAVQEPVTIRMPSLLRVTP
jgi:hypothetical protein